MSYKYKIIELKNWNAIEQKYVPNLSEQKKIALFPKPTIKITCLSCEGL